MGAVPDWYSQNVLLVEGNNWKLSDWWLEGTVSGFASNVGSVEWRACCSTVEEGIFEGMFDSRFASAALWG
jgi:hypothetical protein